MLGNWDHVVGLTVQQSEVFSGQYAISATSTGQPAFARTRLGGSYRDLYYRIKFNASSLTRDDWVYLMKFRTAADTPILSLAIDSGRLTYRNDVENPPEVLVPGVRSAQEVSLGSWHEVQVHLHIGGADSLVEVWYDGLPLDDMRTTESLGNAPIAGIQLGESLPLREFDVAFDEIVVATSYCGETFTQPGSSSDPRHCGSRNHLCWNETAQQEDECVGRRCTCVDDAIASVVCRDSSGQPFATICCDSPYTECLQKAIINLSVGLIPAEFSTSDVELSEACR
jgi:hypothetical protein